MAFKPATKGPANYTRTGLTNEMVLRALTESFESSFAVSARMKWTPSPETVARLGIIETDNALRYTTATAKIRLVDKRCRTMAGMYKSRQGLEYGAAYVDTMKVDGKQEYRINENGKARIKAIEDQARRKHTAPSRTGKLSRK